LSDIHEQELESKLYILLKDFLELCDLVKFAKYKPTEEENEPMIDHAVQFVRETMIDMTAVDLETESRQNNTQNSAKNENNTKINDQQKVTNLEEIS